MKHILITFLIVFTLLFSSGCSTYNSMVPTWMEIGSVEKSEKNKDNNNNSDWKWWNPISWF